MLICLNITNPKRNDTFGRNGYTALCPLHEGKIGNNQSYMPIKKPSSNKFLMIPKSTYMSQMQQSNPWNEDSFSWLDKKKSMAKKI